MDFFNSLLDEAFGAEDTALGIGIEIIVFVAMSLEAAIYDYAAWHLGDTYVRNHLDKLDLVSKWLIVPQLITGKAIPTGRPPYERLKALVVARNALVHAKSVPMPRTHDGSVATIDTKAFYMEVLAGARTAMMAIILVSLEMDTCFGDLTMNPLPMFDKERVARSNYCTEMKKLISECRGILKRSRYKNKV
jgi:hypothetical protein